MRKKLPVNFVSAYLALLVATAIWGAAVPIIKATLNDVPIFTFLFYRFLIVCILLLPAIFIALKKNPIDRRDYNNLILLGLTAQVGIVLVFVGINFTSSIDAAIIGAIGPILILAAGNYFYHERLKFMTKIGVLIATAGTLVIILEPLFFEIQNHTSPELRVLGNILVLTYNVAFAAYVILSKHMGGRRPVTENKTFRIYHIQPMQKKYSPFLQTAVTFYIALAVIIPLYVMESMGIFGTHNFTLQNINIYPVMGILYMSVFSSIAAYTLFEWGVTKGTVKDTAIFGYLGPLFTIPFSYLILREVPTTTALMGMAIITLGVVIAEKNKG